MKVASGSIQISLRGSILAALTTREDARASPVAIFLGTSRLAVRRSVLDRVLPVSETLLADLSFAVAVAASGALFWTQR